MTALSTVETESKPGWLTSWFPTPLATTTPSSCLSLGMGSWEAWAPCTITPVVRLLAVLACICIVKGISWSRRAVVCAVIWVANLSSQAVTTLAWLFLAFNLNFSWWYGLPSILRSCISSKPSATSPKFCSRRTSNSLTVLLGVIQKTSSAKPKHFWQRIRFFSDSQRSSYFVIARAWSHQVEKSPRLTSPLRSGKGPQLPGSNWKPLLIFIIILVSVLKGNIHFVQSATPSFALKATYLLLPWFQGILPFLILHETRANPNYKISQWKMHKNWQVTQGTTNIVTFACRENEGSKGWHILSPKK